MCGVKTEPVGLATKHESSYQGALSRCDRMGRGLRRIIVQIRGDLVSAKSRARRYVAIATCITTTV